MKKTRPPNFEDDEDYLRILHNTQSPRRIIPHQHFDDLHANIRHPCDNYHHQEVIEHNQSGTQSQSTHHQSSWPSTALSTTILAPPLVQMGHTRNEQYQCHPLGNIDTSRTESNASATVENKEFYENLPFPLKLHYCLDDAPTKSFEHIISWQFLNIFKVHDPEAFVQYIMPRYFSSQTKYTSFQRQLNLYGFERIESGPFRGGYQHHLFFPGQRELSMKMSIQKIKGISKRHSPSSSRAKIKGDTQETKNKSYSKEHAEKSKPQDETEPKSASFGGKKFYLV